MFNINIVDNDYNYLFCPLRVRHPGKQLKLTYFHCFILLTPQAGFLLCNLWFYVYTRVFFLEHRCINELY